MHDFLVGSFGAVPGVEESQSAAVQRAIDAAHRADGGRVVIPTGESFVTGSLTLKSGVELHLEQGATLRGSVRRDDYAEEHVAGEYGSGLSGFLIRAEGAEHIGISGEGVIDQRGIAFTDGYKTPEGPFARKYLPWRPRMIGFFGCRHVALRDVTLRDSANWCVHLLGCDEVDIERLTIRNRLDLQNCDGIDPDHCTNVRIRDCDIESADDSIVIKATREGCQRGYEGSHNISVTGCRLTSTSAAVKIGTESQADFSALSFSDCQVRSSSRGLAIQLRDGGSVEDVSFYDIDVETRLFHDIWWGKSEPIYVTALPRHDGGSVGRIRRVRFEEIRCRGESGAFLAASEPGLVDDVTLVDVQLEIHKWSRWPGGLHDRRPIHGGEHVGLTEHPTSGLYLQNVQDSVLRDVTVTWGERRPTYFRHAIEAVGCDGLRLERFRGDAAYPERDAALNLR